MLRKLDDFLGGSKIWPFRNDILLEHMIRTQIGVARRRQPLYFWRFRKDLSARESIRREAEHLKRKYDDPIPAYLYVDPSSPKETLQKSGVVTEIDHTVKIDLGECIRLGELYECDEDLRFDFRFYLPKSGDVYQWNFTLYEISDIAPDMYYPNLEQYVVWSGASTIFHLDSTDPNRPLKVIETPPEVEIPKWLR